MMKINEMREKSTAELNDELRELKEELFKLRFRHATRQLDNPLQLKEVERQIARVKTVLREAELAGKVR